MRRNLLTRLDKSMPRFAIATRGIYNVRVGHVAELVYAHVSEACLARGGSSTLPMPTMSEANMMHERCAYAHRGGDEKGGAMSL